jgi:hypothetical protein
MRRMPAEIGTNVDYERIAGRIQKLCNPPRQQQFHEFRTSRCAGRLHLDHERRISNLIVREQERRFAMAFPTPPEKAACSERPPPSEASLQETS